jgi:alanyl-tRNA synthetase
MGAEVSAIEIQANALTESQIDRAEERANALTREGRPVHIRFEESERVTDLRKPSGKTGTLRVIEIEDFDRSACGGTHVRSTAEIAPIQLRRLEKIRGNTRLEFVCGNRAIRRAKQDLRLLTEASRLGAGGIDKVPKYVASLQKKLAHSDKARQRLALGLARLEADALYESTMPARDGIRRISLHVEMMTKRFG